MKTVEVEVYTIDELSESAQQRAYQKWLECTEVFFEHEIEDITHIASFLGITIDKLYFSGFYSQGDGAMFEGRYQYNPNWNTVSDDSSDWHIMQIGEQLEELYTKYGDMVATIKHDNSRYCHAYTAQIVVDLGEDEDIYDQGARDLCDVLRDFMKWSYRMLELENDYQTSFEYFMDTADDYKNYYTEDGELFK